MKKVLLIHNEYKVRGGEDSVFDSELKLLQDNDILIKKIIKTNNSIGIKNIGLVKNMIWSLGSKSEIFEIIEKYNPDMIHVHNTFPLISPSIYSAIKSRNIPIVQTLHNFRLLCANAIFLRDGKTCEDCINKIPWRSVLHGCYRNSKLASFAATSVIATHRVLKTYEKYVDRFIVLSEFSKAKFIEAGFDEQRLCIKPNFVDIAKTRDTFSRRDGLFVGRLSEEKGIKSLIDACNKSTGLSITVIGDGDMRHEVEHCSSLHCMGFKNSENIYEDMQNHLFLVVPSIWYEQFPRVIVEAFANGLPVIASNMGSLSELVEDGKTGLLFKPGDVDDLAKKMRWANENRDAMLLMGRNARKVYEEKYTPDRNFELLMSIYNEAIEHAATNK